MLTEKYKDFIEEIAKKVRSDLHQTQAPNKYNYDEVLRWLKKNGAEVKHGEFNHTIGNIIYLTCFEEKPGGKSKRLNIKDYDDAKTLFHEIWHFIVNSISLQFPDSPDIAMDPESGLLALNKTDKNFTPHPIIGEEIAGNYFAQAILLPEDEFVKSIMNNVSINGSFNVHNVATYFSTSYPEVISRGRDLSLWSK